MATDCLWELQKAIYSALSGDATLAAMITGIYSHVPQETAFPYIKFDSFNASDASNLQNKGIRAEFSLAIYSRERGSKEALEIEAELKRLLNGVSLAMAGCQMHGTQYSSGGVSQQNDGITWLCRANFVAVVIEA